MANSPTVTGGDRHNLGEGIANEHSANTAVQDAYVFVALHQYWRGSAAIVVSVVGWVLALRAFLLMAFPHAFMAAASAAMAMTALWVSVDIFVGVVGLYLTFVGWGPPTKPPDAQVEIPASDLPHAA